MLFDSRISGIPPMTVADPDPDPDRGTGPGTVDEVVDLGLSSRVENALLRSGIQSLDQLTSFSARCLVQEIIGLGSGSLAEIQEALAAKDLSLAPDKGAVRIPYGKRRFLKGQTGRPVPGRLAPEAAGYMTNPYEENTRHLEADMRD